MKKINKAVILAAGYGTRFLPFSKSVYKGMLPIIDTPTIELIVDELASSGISDILMIVGFNKEDVIKHFSANKHLEDKFANDKEKLELVTKQQRVKISFVEQKIINGTGGALMLAKSFTGDEPFALAFADDLIKSKTPATKQLIDVYNKTGKAVLGCQNVSKEDIVRYSSAEYSKKDGNVYTITKVIEKPKLEEVKSTLSTLGRYIFLPEIYELVENLKVNEKCNELCITDTYSDIASKYGLMAVEFEGKHYDIGNKFGYLTAIFDYALESSEYKDKLTKYIKNKLK